VTEREPLLLSPGVAAGARTLAGDLVNYTLVLLFTVLCHTVGRSALLLDRRFGSRWYDRFIAANEYIDNGGR
jgi:hypothetical protein